MPVTFSSPQQISENALWLHIETIFYQFWAGLGYSVNFLHSVIFLIFQNHQNTGHLQNITFILGRYHCSWDAETPDKYEPDFKYLTYVFNQSKFPTKDKLTNGL